MASYSYLFQFLQLDVSKNSGTPKSSILIGCSIIDHPFWGTSIFGNTQLQEDNEIPYEKIKSCFG